MSDKDIFKPLGQQVEGDDGPQTSEIESLCLNCYQNGMTRLLFTTIPHFKEVVTMSFHCDSCGWSNNELQPAATIQEKGISFKLECTKVEDLNRQVVKTEWAEISIPEVEFEVTKQPGLITTIEGIIDRAIEGLQEAVPKIKDDPESVIKLTAFVSSLHELKTLPKPFHFILSDATGNSYIENPFAPEPDPNMQISYYERTIQQDKLIGLLADDADDQNGTIKEEEEDVTQLIKGEVLDFPTNCHNCNAPCMTSMKVTDIPHFKEIIIMATNCDACGHRTNEVKSGSGIDEKGVRITVKIESEDQLKYDVVKSDICSIEIPEIDLQLSSTGSGKYTTVEGLVEHIKAQLILCNPFVIGDSASVESRKKMEELVKKLNNVIGLTIILDDPSGASFVEMATDVVHYERTFEQNEELGLNDMKTENY